jgi:hypothetical protein
MEGFDVFSSYSSLRETPSRAGAVAEARFLVSIESFAEFVARLARVLASAFTQEFRWVDNNSTPSGPLRAASPRPIFTPYSIFML